MKEQGSEPIEGSAAARRIAETTSAVEAHAVQVAMRSGMGFTWELVEPPHYDPAASAEQNGRWVLARLGLDDERIVLKSVPNDGWRLYYEKRPSTLAALAKLPRVDVPLTKAPLDVRRRFLARTSAFLEALHAHVGQGAEQHDEAVLAATSALQQFAPSSVTKREEGVPCCSKCKSALGWDKQDAHQAIADSEIRFTERVLRCAGCGEDHGVAWFPWDGVEARFRPTATTFQMTPTKNSTKK
ncbi:MAG: hypothetical protein IT378_07920 [Sandaracinaceae bacterium]|nr:hypothetical protein [Sandaracinaceae bacterium]